MKSHISRRDFLRRSGALAVAGTLGAGRATASIGPNDKIRLGVIGCGGMGGRHIEALATNPNCTLVMLCDAFIPRYEKAIEGVKAATGVAPEGVQDYRKVLERPDIDAIFNVTTDNWHPLITIHGCEAGKDVYVEKPVCMTVAEGRAMVNAARRYGRVVQVGTQQRSMPIFQEAIEIVKSGRLGQITTAGAWVGVNGMLEAEVPRPAPEGLDWDRWQGPAPDMPFSRERFMGWMGWHDYARGGELTNWGIHLMDIVQWGIGKDRPLSVQSMGGTYVEGTGADNYQSLEALLEYEGCNVTWEQRDSNTHAGKGYGVRFNGTKGVLYVNRISYSVEPAELGIKEVIGEPERSWANPDHHNNFFESIRTRKRPIADIEQGFRSTTAVLLAGIALKTRRKLYWDGTAEQFINDDAANRYLSRPYRAPWHL
jgi:predicted dehydrogenase